MRVGLNGAAHILRCTPSAVNNWSKLKGFPKPVMNGAWREWAPEELEAWATANWEGKKSLRQWAIEKGYAQEVTATPPGGITAEDWDRTALLRKTDVAKMLGMRQASGGRVFDRRDFPAPVASNPLRWSAADVLDWAKANAHLKTLSGWVDAQAEAPVFKGYVIHDIAALVGLSVRATRGLMERDYDFPLEIAPGGWDKGEVDSWKSQHFDSPDYPHKRG